MKKVYIYIYTHFEGKIIALVNFRQLKKKINALSKEKSFLPTESNCTMGQISFETGKSKEEVGGRKAKRKTNKNPQQIFKYLSVNCSSKAVN